MDGMDQDQALDWGDDEDDDDLYNINEEQVNTFLASTSKLQTSNSSVKTHQNVWGDQYLSTKSWVGSPSTSASNCNVSSPYTGSFMAAPNIVSIGCPRTSNDTDATVLPGFDAEAGNTWIYPINYPIRDYQFNIAHQAIFKNTLVSLPTGLGKTFIAAVVMYNLYRWYPTGKVIFLAPTRTLVAQQIEACFKVMGIPQEDMIQMTGAVAPEKRRCAWLNKRLFFLTPQVVVNDLSRGVCPGATIRCVVVDEAHRATGGHAYCQLMESLQQHTRHTRILALSATPGVDLASVQQVVSNLFISHIELRSDDSPDIAPFTHTRVIDKVVVPLGEHLTMIRDTYLRVVRVFVIRLVNMGVLYTKDETTLTKFQVLKAREACRAAPPPGVSAIQLGSSEGLFALCLTLYHALDLLLQHGARSFYNFMQATMEGEKGQNVARSELLRNKEFHGLMNPLREQYGGRAPPGHSFTGVVGTPNRSSPVLHATTGMRPPNTLLGTLPSRKPNVVIDGTASRSEDSAADDTVAAMPASHPKMVKLLEVVKDHFEKCTSEGRITKVIIFSQYRDSVAEITELLSDLAPLVRPMSFLGQSTNSKTGRGTSQKDQIMVVKKFRAGDYNTLVSTCVGEEGLDIGEVDLIVCYDSLKSPVRLVQRMGRTGRNRQGRIVVLLTKGKEEQASDQ